MSSLKIICSMGIFMICKLNFICSHMYKYFEKYICISESLHHWSETFLNQSVVVMEALTFFE